VVAPLIVLLVAAGCSSSSKKSGPATTQAATATTAVAAPTTTAVPCQPAPDNETGVTPTSVTVGTIISNSPLLPQQQYPSYKGTEAYFNRINAEGGVRDRKIKSIYSNDNLKPAQQLHQQRRQRDPGQHRLHPLPAFSDTNDPRMQQYMQDLKTVPNAQPSAFSLLGYTSAIMFVQALRSGGAAPTRACVMHEIRGLHDYATGGLVGPLTPFQTIPLTCTGNCGSFKGTGTFNWKPGSDCWVLLQVQMDASGTLGWVRVSPQAGFSSGQPHVARGTAA